MRAAGGGFFYFLVCLLFWAVNIEIFERTGGSTATSSRLRRNGTTACGTATDKEEEEEERFSHLLLTTDYQSLLDHVRHQRDLMEQNFREDYSQYYESLFYTPHQNISRGKLVLYNPLQPQGWNTLKRRLQIKLLTVQEGLLLQKEAKKRCDEGLPPHTPTTTKWIHAIGGHSSSAGHGNFVEDSYGAVMDAALQPLFDSLNLQLETRVYGMSGKPSAPEMALCQEAVLGIDTDMITWDYAQTDTGHYWNFEFWMQRATLLQSHPILLANQIQSQTYTTHNVVENLHKQHPHLPLLVINQTVVREMESMVPDTLQNFNLPPLLNNLKCGEENDILEVNEPCKDQKFNQDVCNDRYWKAPWHPGYRRLALFGKLLALGIADAMEEAVQDLLLGVQDQQDDDEDDDYEEESSRNRIMIGQANNDNDNNNLAMIQTKLQQLKEHNQQQIQQMMLASKKYHPRLGKLESPELSTIFPGLNTSWLYDEPALCRTMRLPSQQRYKGINTGHAVEYTRENNHTGLVPTKGIEHEEIILQGYSNNNYTNTNKLGVEDALEMELGYDNKARISQRSCPNRTTNYDYSDYLYVTDTWRKTILPSVGEIKEYFAGDSGKHTFHGLVIICPLQCDRQTKICYKDEILNPPKHWDRLDIQVNGIPVVKMIQFMTTKECGILRHEQGFVFPPKVTDGTYDLRVRINPEKVQAPEEEGGITKILQIASIVLI